jgi:uncharacterized membrane protein YeiH
MNLIYLFDIFGVAVFAVTGAILATRKKFDIFGVIVIGFVTALGGGSLRDLLLGTQPVFWLKDINYFYAVISSALLTFVLYNRIIKINNVLRIFDALGLGVFTIIGIQKTLQLNISPVFAIMMGVVTAVAGGIIRDILCQEIPLVLRKEVYATACILGGVFYFLLRYLGLGSDLLVILSIMLIIIIRLVAIYYNLALPKRK